ncbi:uncharacterized protein LOC111265453 isoform X3 [Varroa jacobsoni]|uniref:uncharacterized protein LOC111265453 isoform X3 n=1 Tax=Varroa jacobsoni TaxID=62625 RepID=UPI000BF6C072|nr:uncharacterized protein LOC111265453 isoform X3 [Varroa jacobsoni]XP_022697893.1 uncharacterized protein LOC111265453 isoform X3 [Varroa jacobsoni]
MILEGILLTISGLLIHIRAQSEYDKVSIKAEFIVKSFTLHDARPGVFVLWPQAKKNMVISDGAGTNFRVKFKVGLSPECDTNTIIGRKIECSLEPFRLLTAEDAPLPKFPARMQTFCHLAIPSHRELTKLTIEMQRVFRDIFGNIRLEDVRAFELFPRRKFMIYVEAMRQKQTKSQSRGKLL